ncbi:MAG: hypothetical protein H6721_13210 [Sandaracinus sp.]|nr:hypothetical protein [Sandaracinus sp.]
MRRYVLLFALASMVSGRSAVAQDAGVGCDEPPFRGPVEVTPASGASNVTVDAYVKVLYGEGTLGPEIDPSGLIELRLCNPGDVLNCDRTGELVPGRAEIVGDRWLFFVPDGDLPASSDFAGIARGAEADLDFNFRTGMRRDTESPSLGPIDTPTTQRVDRPCEGGRGFRVDVRFDPAIDDGPPGSVEYLLYLTRGPSVRAPELRARVRNLATAETTMAFVLSDDEAVAPVCIVVHAVDGLGNADTDMEPVCFEPVQGTYFESCSVSAAGTGGSTSFAFVVVGLAAWTTRRRRARR